MKKIILTVFLLAGCSVFGESGVETAPYTILKSDVPFEVRHYESLVLVTTSMDGMKEQKSPFYKLFNYISGENSKEQKISMTAPVFMDQSDGETQTMSFVLPQDFSMENTPVPLDATVQIDEIKDYTVAAIIFSGFLKQENIQENQNALEKWIKDQGYKIAGKPKAAGYNPPFTIPMLRRNEVLIPIKKP